MIIQFSRLLVSVNYQNNFRLVFKNEKLLDGVLQQLLFTTF